ncbi:MAG: hypothetical protein ABSF84_04215 [Acidimicrobiales bacterium]|jgi:hypothetical protein
MHRSGTSALTGLLAGLGMALPPESDIVTGMFDNPVHFESRALIALNDRLLGSLGGWWDAPPGLPPGWESDERVTSYDDEARATLLRIYGGPGPKVWKDPRLSLLLPYWKRHLHGPTPVVFVWRRANEVRDSLQRRDGSTASHALALWDRYVRTAMADLVGQPVYVLSSDELLDDPRGTAEALVEWLGAQGVVPPVGSTWDLESATAAISPRLAHRGESGPTALPPEIARMAEALEQFAGPHDALPATVFEPAPGWATDALDEHGRLLAVQDDLTRKWTDALDAYAELEAAYRALEEVYRNAAGLADERLELIESLEAAASVTGEELEAHRAEIARAHAHAAGLALELDRIRTSRSWTLTAPLRRVGRRGGSEPEG